MTVELGPEGEGNVTDGHEAGAVARDHEVQTVVCRDDIPSILEALKDMCLDVPVPILQMLAAVMYLSFGMSATLPREAGGGVHVWTQALRPDGTLVDSDGDAVVWRAITVARSAGGGLVLG